MAEAGAIAGGERQRRPHSLERLLTGLEEQARIACQISQTSLYQKHQQPRQGGLMDDEGEVDWEEVNRKLQEETMLSAGALVAALVIMVSTLCIADVTLRWMMALIWNRKACRIPASLHLMGRKVCGQVMTLGRGGCRFQPMEMRDFNLISDALEAGTPTLHLVDKAMTVRASAFYEEVMDFRFEVPLTLRIQRALLEHSTISPYYVRKSRGGTADTRRLQAGAQSGSQ